MRTVLLINHAPDPRMRKRAAVLREMGEVHLICLKRRDVDIWDIDESGFDSVTMLEREMPSSSAPAKRLLAMREFAREAIGRIREIAPQCIYTENLDCLGIVHLCRGLPDRCKIIYEVADIREILLAQAGMKQRAVKFVEKLLIPAVDCLVVTSEKFYDDYYRSLLPDVQVVFAPNAPNEQYFESYTKKSSGRFRIGFIGAVRYVEQMKLLIDVAGDFDGEVLIAGSALNAEVEEAMRKYAEGKTVIFSGKYDYAKDIASLYSQIDCVYAVYDSSNPNVRMALPNKLYEAIFCGLPIIVAKGTYLAELVEKWGVGFAVDSTAPDDLCALLTMLSTSEGERDRIRENCLSIARKAAWNDWSAQLKDYCNGG